MKPFAINIFPTEYHIPENDIEFNLSNKEIELVTLKQRDRGNDYVMRLFNNDENIKKATLSLGRASIDLSFNKFEVKTIVYNPINNALTEIEEMII